MRTSTMRRLTLALLAGTISLSIAGCSGGGTVAAPDRTLAPPVAGEIAQGALSGTTLTFASTGGIVEEGTKTAIWDPFEKQSGATVVQDAYDEAKLKAMVESGQVVWDITVASQFSLASWCGTLYEKIDFSQVDTSKVPEGLTTDCSIPQISYGMVVVYNTDKFGDNPPTSLADFFDTTKYPGKRGVNMTPYVDPQTLEIALLAEGKDPKDFTTDDIPAAIAKYRSLGSDLVGWTSGAQAQQQLESGEVAMSLVWSGRGYGAAAAGAKVAPIWNEWTLLTDSLAIPKGAKDVQASLAALNYYLGADQQAALTEQTSYGGSNIDSKPSVDPLLSDWLVTDHLDTAHRTDLKFWVDNADAVSSAWGDWISGVQ